MEINEIYLLTAFVCSACDGEIAPEEVALVKEIFEKSDGFDGHDIETKLNEYVISINKHGIGFINEFLCVLENTELTSPEQLEIVRIAIDMIEADGKILYSEVKFFKKLRKCLNISDEEILKALPDKEDYLLPDIQTNDFTFEDDIQFAEIKFTVSE